MQAAQDYTAGTHRKKALKVLKSAALCSIQDLGRPGSQHLGFSTGGAADEHAYLTANLLLGNDANAAALEITLGQLVLRAECDCTIAVTGADCRAQLNEKPLANWQLHQLKSGDILSFSLPSSGLHSYLAVSGGIDAPCWLGSRAQTLNELALTGIQEKITANSDIPLTSACFDADIKQPATHRQPPGRYQSFYCPGTLTARFIPHQLWYSLDHNSRQAFLDAEYKIDRDSNRMGYRLTSLAVAKTEQQAATTVSLPGKLSRAVTFGTIQLPDFHHPIILMKERQTIGGYPVIGAVMQTDLFRLSQKRPGESVRFVPIGLAQAQQQLAGFYRQRMPRQ